MSLLPMDSSATGQPLGLTDAFDRPLRNLRLSVTDRCNLRCQYCMPEEEYTWLPREDLLTFEEIATLVDVFTALGVEKVRLTGGEPLLRRDVATLVRLLARNPRVQDLALTTNGVLLAEQAQALYDAGLHRITVSLDTLKPERFRALTRRDTHARVLAGIEAVRQVGFTGLKLDTVVMRGTNDDELVDLIEYGKQVEAEVRFIEYMDVGGATSWTMEKVCSRTSSSHDSASTMDPLYLSSKRPGLQRSVFAYPTGQCLALLLPRLHPFVVPVTAAGSRPMACGIYASMPVRGSICDSHYALGLRQRSLPPSLSPAGRDVVTVVLRSAKPLKRMVLRSTLIPLDRLRQDPHLEMHTRGG